MITIPIQVSGDIWGNPDNVKQLLDQTQPGQQVTLDLFSEGPSLRQFGIVDLISAYNLDVAVTRWANSVEEVPYHRVSCNKNSHFFPMCHHYWQDEVPTVIPAEYRFGLFQGRGCPSRNRIMHDAVTLWSEHFLLSKMRDLRGDPWGYRQPDHSKRLESMSDWFADVDYARNWLDNCSITSIDNCHIQDQYGIPEVSAGKVATSLLQHYPRFNVELICETYTLGDTFFPTEKTVRPLVGERPFIVYGSRNYLANLQQSGYRTFASLWDESYDRLEGVERWAAMTQLINHLVALPASEWQHIITQSIEITKHNKAVLGKNVRDFKSI